ncbi:MAG: iron-containing alcohol dehydrogenase [Bacillota bacterium]|nr:iron-containing alcohol dehydrogenase [Bacillota bacterium]
MVNPFSLPGVNYFGKGALENLTPELRNFKAKKVFLVSDHGVANAGLVDKVKIKIEEAGAEAFTYLEVTPEPSVEDLNRCLEVYKKNNCDLIIGLGGGSPLDVAKGVSILATCGGSILDYVGLNLVPQKGIPKFLIPTTAGTGAEVTKNAIFTDKKEQLKKGVVSIYLLPEIAIVDSDLTMSMPPHVTAATGMDALTHAIESYTSPKATVQTDLYALKAIELIGASLRRAVSFGSDEKAREKMALGSVFAGISLANAGVGAVHACAYPLGGQFGTGHGVTNALLLPYIMERNIIGDLQKFANIACALGEVTEMLPLREQAQLACEAVFALSRDIGIPQKLTEFGVKKEDIPGLAEAAMQVTRLMDNNPKKLTLEEVTTCLYRALD